MIILALILIPFAIIYDLVNWFMSKSSWRFYKRPIIQKIHVVYLKVDDNYEAKYLQKIEKSFKN